MANEGLKVFGAGFCGAITIASIIMFACSFDTISPHQIGLHYNAPTLHLHSNTYRNGRYFLGLGHSFKKFPRGLIYIEFSAADGDAPVGVWTNDGQEVNIEIGFYVQLNPNRLAEMYYKYENDYISVMEDIALNAVRDVTTMYNTTDFFEKRSEINTALQAELNLRINEQLFATVPDFNLLNIAVPSPFETAVLNKVIMQQLQSTLEYTQQAQEIRANTNVTVATYNQYLTTQFAQFEYNATLIVQRALADAYHDVQVAKADILKNLTEALDFTVAPAHTLPDGVPLLKFLYMDLLQAVAPQSKIAVDFPSSLYSL